MFRLNRFRVIGLFLTGFIVYFLFLSSANSNSDFRRRTEEGLSRRHGHLQGDLSDEEFRDVTNQRLNNILAQKDQDPMAMVDGEVKPAPPRVAPIPKENYYNNDDDKSTPVAGRKTMQKPKEKEKPKYPVEKASEGKQDRLASDEDDSDSSKTNTKSSDPGKDFAREKLQEYLKKPIIIFSKSYCPHSKKAKHLLLDLYKITPAPLVVELDHMSEKVPTNHSPDDEDAPPAPTLGQKLQELLGEITGRRTVPNIMVGTTSIGGNDLIWEMHAEGTLADRIKALGGKRITSVEVVEDMESGKGNQR